MAYINELADWRELWAGLLLSRTRLRHPAA